MRRALFGAVFFAGVLGGCVLVSGGTGGYTTPDAGSLPCGGASDCGPGQLCCMELNLSGGNPSITVSCQTPEGGAGCPGGEKAVQVCASDAECGDAGPCVRQQCSVGSVPTTFGACATIPLVCTVVASPGVGADSATDGPAEGASPVDAAPARD